MTRTGPKGCWLAAALPALLFLLLPLAALVSRSTPDLLIEAFREEGTLQALLVSLKTSAWALALVILFGTPAAILIGCYRFPLRNGIRAMVAVPAILPPAAAGLGLLLAFGRAGLLGGFVERFGFSVAFTPLAVVMAQAFVSSPFYILQAAAAFGRHEPDIDDSAALDGAGPAALVAKVLIPVHARSLVAAALLAWARALGEFGATILFAGSLAGETQTMPLAIYLGFESDIGQAIALAVLLVFAALLILAAALYLLRGAEQ